MRGKIVVMILVISLFLIGCQIPQYTAPEEAADAGDHAEEMEELTEGEEELTPEEKAQKAREEFKKKLLEQQTGNSEQEEGTKPAEPAQQEQAQPAEPVQQNTAAAQPQQIAQTATTGGGRERPAPKTVTSPERNTRGQLIINVNEGDTIALDLKARDPDGDDLTYKIDQPFSSAGVWETSVGDAGQHVINFAVSDGELTTQTELIVNVRRINNAPVLAKINKITVAEGDEINLPLKATDADGDELTYSVVGWRMTGPTYRTTFDDAGLHQVTVTVSDGELTDSQPVVIEVTNTNRAPIVEW